MMSILDQIRNIESYLQKIKLKAPGTVRVTRVSLRRFDAYLLNKYQRDNVDIISELKLLEDRKQFQTLMDLLQDFINYLSEQGLRPQALRNYLGHVKGYLKYHGFKIHSEDIKDAVTLPRIIEEEKAPLTREQFLTLLHYSRPDRIAFYLVNSSSGMRPGESCFLRKRDYDTQSYQRIMIRIPAKYTKTKKARITFVSKEAEKYLIPILKSKGPDDFVFSPNNNPEQAMMNEEFVFNRLRKRAGLIERYDSGTHKITLGDSLRAWFVTKANRTDFGFGHALAGHDLYMKRYDRLSIKEKLDLYLKAEPEIMVFEDSRKDLEIHRLKKDQVKIKELEDLKQAVKTDEQRLADAEQVIQDIIDGKFSKILEATRSEIPVDDSLDKVDLK